jgi:hypothetical protein
MKITVSFESETAMPNFVLPDSITGSIDYVGTKEGLSGQDIMMIINVALDSIADLTAIALFIYEIIKDKKKAHATANGIAVPEPLTQENITNTLNEANDISE